MGGESRVSRTMPVRTALLLGALLLAGPALAQQSAAAVRPDSEPVPAEPAPAPPAPADLALRPQAAQPQAAAESRPIALPPGLEALPQGAWRLRFAQGSEVPARTADAALAELGRRLAALPEGRVVLYAQASGPTTDVST